MSRTTVIDIPLGDHAGKCTIEVPIAAAASPEHSKTISTITEEITSSIYRATTPAAQEPVEVENPKKRQRQDGNDEDESMPVLDPNNMPDNAKWVDFFMQDVHGEMIRCAVEEHGRLERHCRAYATLRGMTPECFRFDYDGERLGDNSTAASLGLENGDVIQISNRQIGS
ncbi:SUMO protein smt3 [Elasticomyces elasticus]|nr:SUMO protein smt3 [Elasticomyces elasticus]